MLPEVTAVTLGDPGAAASWRPVRRAEGGDAWFDIDYGKGCVFDAALFEDVRTAVQDPAVLARLGEPDPALVSRLEWEGRAVAVVFECGMGAGSYPLFLGVDAGDVPVAVMADLEVLQHAERRLD